MERFQLDDFNMLMGLTPDSAINTPRVLQAQLVGILANRMMPGLPQLTTRPSQMVGAGVERAQKLRRGWWAPRQFQVSGELNTETAACLGSRCLGGTVTPTGMGGPPATAYDQVTLCQVKAQGRIPKLTTFFFLAGGYDFVWPSCAVGKFTINFAGENDVTFQADMINTGYWLHNDGVDVNPAVTPVDPPNHHLMHPAATRVTFSDGRTRDYAADGDLISGSCSFDNQIVVRQLPGDPFRITGDRRKGAYARDIHHGSRVPFATLKSAMTSDLRQFTLMMNGTKVTNVTYLFVGEEKIGATAFDYEFEWKYPVAEIEAVESSADGNDAAIDINFYPETDAVSGGYVIQRVRTDAATLT